MAGLLAGWLASLASLAEWLTGLMAGLWSLDIVRVCASCCLGFATPSENVNSVLLLHYSPFAPSVGRGWFV